MKFGDAMRLAGVTNMLIAESGFEKISRGRGTGIQVYGEPSSTLGTKWPNVQQQSRARRGFRVAFAKKKKDFGFQAQLKKNSVTWLERAK